MDRRTAAEWNSIPDRRYTVVDPDGWDRKNWESSGWDTELITYEEFELKAMWSSCVGLPLRKSTDG